ncbi:MAG: methyltransferase domain-containing protein [Planctomycetaceae bacterium]|nr:methyltransferase domain-containing protein [Planctomycetaceae bacterium]
MISTRFPRASGYHPEWVLAGASGGANPLWLTEWLTEKLDLRPGMRVLDLGCGRAMSSIFLHREFGVQVWATDLWFSADENRQRIDDAGMSDGVFPLHAEARSLPFASGFFDAIVCIDSYLYYGTDDLALNAIVRLLKPGGVLAIAGAGLMQEIDGAVPDALRDWWEPGMWCLHSAAWWRRHWEKTGLVTVEVADDMPDGWQAWLDWQRVSCPENTVELQAIEADRGRTMGYVRAIARLKSAARLEAPITSINMEYTRQPLLREVNPSG